MAEAAGLVGKGGMRENVSREGEPQFKLNLGETSCNEAQEVNSRNLFKVLKKTLTSI